MSKCPLGFTDHKVTWRCYILYANDKIHQWVIRLVDPIIEKHDNSVYIEDDEQ